MLHLELTVLPIFSTLHGDVVYEEIIFSIFFFELRCAAASQNYREIEFLFEESEIT